MGLSTHEMLILLRARDEASRILSRMGNASGGLTSKIRETNTALSSNGTALRLVESSMGSTIKKYESAQTGLQGLQTQYAGLKTKVNDATTQFNSNKTAISGLVTQHAALNTKQQVIYSNIDKINSANLLGANIHPKVIQGMKDEISWIEQQKSSITGKITTLTRENNAVQKTIAATDAKSKAIFKEIGDLGREKDALGNSVDAMGRHRDELYKDREGLLANADALEKQHAAIQKNMAQGAALTSSGILMAGFGAAIVGELKQASDAYGEYYQASSKTFTQVDKSKDSVTKLNTVMQYGSDTASRFAVKYEEVQPALYDVFSTIETDGPGAKTILDGIAVAAVGGATTMESAGRSVMGIMNAWKLSADKVNYVNDIMFQLVRKGTGTYDEFAAAFGKGIPSSVKAGQSIETVAAMLAFMTKNGMTAANAGTSVGRSMDMLSNPVFATNIKALGVNAFDAAGKLRPMGNVVTDLRNKVDGLSDKDRLNFIAEMGKGAGGTIQAMRFMNLGLTDIKETAGDTKLISSSLFKQMQLDMANAKDAASDAYKIMSDTPEARWQLLSNQAELLSQNIGKGVQPIRDFITGALTPMFEWFNKLSPGMQQNISTFAAVVAAVLILVGVILSVVGVIMLFGGALAMMGGSAGLMAILGPIGLVILAIMALIAVGFLIVSNWELIKTTAINVWNAIVAWVIGAGNAIVAWWTGLPAFFAGIWNAIVQWAISSWNGFLQFMSNLWLTIVAGVTAFGAMLMSAAGIALGAVIGFVMSIWNPIYGVLSGPFDLFRQFFQTIWETIKLFFAAVLLTIFGIATGNINLIVTAWAQFGVKVAQLWKGLWNGVVALAISVWNTIVNAFNTFTRNLVTFVVNLATGVASRVKKMWNDVVVAFTNGILAATRYVSEFPGKVLVFFANLVINGKAKVNEFSRMLVSGFLNMVNGAVDEAKKLPSKVLNALTGIASAVRTIGQNIINGIKQGVLDAAMGLINSIKDVVNDAIRAAKNLLGIKSPSKVFDFIGRMSIAGLTGAFDKGRSAVSKASERVAAAAIIDPQNFMDTVDYTAVGRSTRNGSGNGSGTSIHVEQTINTQEIDPIKNSADLGYEIAKRLG